MAIPHLISTFFLCLFTLRLHIAKSEPFIGVNIGEVANNLPPATATVKLLQSTTIGKVRLFAPDPTLIKALANTGIDIMLGTSNADVASLVKDPGYAKQWIETNILPYYPASSIKTIAVGNEVLTSSENSLASQLVPAMQNMNKALVSSALGGKIKVSTPHSMAVLKQSDPPSTGKFDPALDDIMTPLLEFLNSNNAPFLVNAYPYFAYQGNPIPDILAFALFQPKADRIDTGSKLTYTNMFDAQVDAVKTALNSRNIKNVPVVVAETGWPHQGDPDEAGATLKNAKTYIGNLIKHLRTGKGTPMIVGKPIETYIFALYDEDLKPGQASERAFGLYKPDLSMTYDIGLSKGPVTPTTEQWCVPKAEATDVQLQANLDYACGSGIDCSPIQPGGACLEPNVVSSHAAYAMNLYYQNSAHDPSGCDFAGTGMLTSANPSYAGCIYPS